MTEKPRLVFDEELARSIVAHERPRTEAGRQLVEDEPRLVHGEHDMRTRVLAIEEAARTEGRQQAVRRIDPEVLAAAIYNCDLADPVTFKLETVDKEAARIAAEYDRVAGLNASESPLPPERPRTEAERMQTWPCAECGEPVHLRHLNSPPMGVIIEHFAHVAGLNTSESPPTARIVTVIGNGDGTMRVELDDGSERTITEAEYLAWPRGDASESGQDS